MTADEVDPEIPVAPLARVASPSDLSELVRLDELARAHMGPHRGGSLYLLHTARPSPPRQSFLHDIDDPTTLAVVGSVAGSVVGYGIASLRPLRDGSTIAEVSELFVEAEAREVGVGEALMGALLEWAESNGCVGIDAHALPGDRSTKNFFESFGLVARAIVVHRDLRGR